MAIVTKEKLDRVYDAYRNGKLSRRHFIKYLGLAGACHGLIRIALRDAVRKAWAAKSIRFDGWGGSVSEAFRKHAFKPFTKATGIEVIDGEFGDMNSYLTRVKASYPPGGEFNIAHLSAVFDYARYAELGFASVLDESKIPNLKNVMGHDQAAARHHQGHALGRALRLGRPASPTTPSTSARKRQRNWVPPAVG
jgi:spermidine/putrescine transport system substrate-binding protein